jgi:hypothetical protein
MTTDAYFDMRNLASPMGELGGCPAAGVGVGPRQVIELMDQFLKKRPVFGLRMAIWAFKLP